MSWGCMCVCVFWWGGWRQGKGGESDSDQIHRQMQGDFKHYERAAGPEKTII